MININYKKLLIHAVSSPLTSLRLNLELAQSTKDSNKKRTYLNQALTNSKYLENIIESIQQKNQSFEWFRVNKAIHEILRLKEHQPLKFSTTLPDNYKVFGNKLLFQEALICLINNGLEAYQSTQKRFVKINVIGYSSKCTIIIEDHGKGLSIFQYILTSIINFSSKKGHLGFGLKFAKKVFKKQFSGQFKIKSNRNHGTKVEVSLFATNKHVTKTSNSFNMSTILSKIHS